jgi:FkbM family methyltransferase
VLRTVDVKNSAVRACDPLIDTKTLFAAIVKKLDADCILDVGSRDGDQSIFFRDISPKAYVAALEANPSNYKAIAARNLQERRIDVFPYAASDSNGTATFYIADPECDPHAIGSSSLLPGGYQLKEKIEVETRRLDDFILEHYPDAQRIGLWIDVESVEYKVLEGISKIKDRVVIIHTETALEPVRSEQKAFAQLSELLKLFGFLFCGSNLREGSNIGDVVFVNGKSKEAMGAAYPICMLRSKIYQRLPIGQTAVYLRQQFPPIYRFLRKAYIRFAT